MGASLMQDLPPGLRVKTQPQAPLPEGFRVKTEGPDRKVGQLNAVAQQTSTGILAGYDDEVLGAAVGAPVGAVRGVYRAMRGEGLEAIPDTVGQEYGRVRDTVRAEKQRNREQRPLSSMAGEGFGAIVSAGRAAAPLLKGGGVATRSARAAGLGAAEAGLYASGEADGGGQERLSAARGAAPLGAGLGLVGTIGAAGVSAGWRSMKNRTSFRNADQAAGARVLFDAMAKDHGPARARQMLNEWDKAGASPEDLIRVQGETGQSVIRAVGLLNEGSSSAAFAALRGKQRGRITDGVMSALGGNRARGKQPPSVSAARRFITFSMKSKANPVYESAYEQGLSPEFYRQSVMPYIERLPKRALRGALSKARASGDRNAEGQLQNAIRGVEQALDLRTFQFVKEEVDDLIGEAYKKGRNREAAFLINNKSNVLSAIDAENPTYAEARKIWSTGSSIQNAFDHGKAITSTTESVDEFAQRLRGMSEAELAAARLQAADTLETKLLAGRDNANDAPRLVTDLMREKLRVLLKGNAQEAEGFIRLVSGVDGDFRLFSQLDPTTNSRTTSNQQALADFSDMVRNPVARGASDISLSPMDTAFRLGKRGADSAFNQRRERIARELADALFLNDRVSLNPGSARSNPTVPGRGAASATVALSVTSPRTEQKANYRR